mmetsp:Transcript_14110/g.46072  ORF Transcript_14110/g.46072 Transcript_14110/m.46072 type:complete len:302 (+) Transcript_14110:378-1283(+)
MPGLGAYYGQLHVHYLCRPRRRTSGAPPADQGLTDQLVRLLVGKHRRRDPPLHGLRLADGFSQDRQDQGLGPPGVELFRPHEHPRAHRNHLLRVPGGLPPRLLRGGLLLAEQLRPCEHVQAHQRRPGQVHGELRDLDPPRLGLQLDGLPSHLAPDDRDGTHLQALHDMVANNALRGRRPRPLRRQLLAPPGGHPHRRPEPRPPHQLGQRLLLQPPPRHHRLHPRRLVSRRPHLVRLQGILLHRPAKETNLPARWRWWGPLRRRWLGGRERRPGQRRRRRRGKRPRPRPRRLLLSVFICLLV